MTPELSLMEPWKLSPTGAPRGARAALPPDLLGRLIPLLPGTTRLIVEISLQTGQPIAEVVTLRLDDVDAVRGRIRLGGRGSRRWIVMPAALRARLADQHRQVMWVYRGDRLAGWGAPSGRGHPAGWLFPAQNPRVQPGGGRKLRVPVSEACVRETVWRVSLIAGGSGASGPTPLRKESWRRREGGRATPGFRGPRGAPAGRRRRAEENPAEPRASAARLAATPESDAVGPCAGSGMMSATGAS